MASECKQQRKTRVVNERAIYRPPPARCILQEKITEPNVDPAPTIQTPNNANLKRPSLPLYVPRGRTSSTSKEEQTNVKETKSSKEIKVPVEQKAKEKQPKKSSSKKASKSLRVPVEDESNQTPVFKDEPSDIQLNAPPQTVRKISRTCSNPVIQPSVLDLGDLMESSELAEFSNQMHEKQVSVSKAEDTDEEDTWEKLYNDTGDLLRPDALEELTVAVGSVQIIKPAPETYRFVASESHDEELAHVIEVYDFPPTLKTEDIFCALTTIGSPADFSLKWVDDTHALAIYGSPYAAIDALSAPRGMVKLRPLAQATKESRNCARRLSSTLQPFKPRPATSASLAKRLVSTALGIKNTVSPEQRKIERQMLADAKAKKRIIAQQREAMWEGTISTP